MNSDLQSNNEAYSLRFGYFSLNLFTELDFSYLSRIGIFTYVISKKSRKIILK